MKKETFEKAKELIKRIDLIKKTPFYSESKDESKTLFPRIMIDIQPTKPYTRFSIDDDFTEDLNPVKEFVRDQLAIIISMAEMKIDQIVTKLEHEFENISEQ